MEQIILEVTGRDKRNKLVEILQKSGSDRTLVFVEKKSVGLIFQVDNLKQGSFNTDVLVST